MLNNIGGNGGASDWPAAIADLPPLREVIADSQLIATRKLGQNFLLDLNLTDRIARAAAGEAGDLSGFDIIEIGPGPGGLTRALLARGARRVIAVERDARAIAALQPLVTASEGRLVLIEGDALEIDLVTLTTAPRMIVANLPYNIATPLLTGWLHRMHDFAGMTLMFQEEVARRIIATPAKPKEYGRLSVLVQMATKPQLVLKLPPRAFTPPPKVTSAVVRFTPLAKPLAPLRDIEQLTAVAFGQRRKMVRSTLLPLVGAEALDVAGILPTMRAEEISVTQYAKLANHAIIQQEAGRKPAGVMA